MEAILNEIERKLPVVNQEQAVWELMQSAKYNLLTGAALEGTTAIAAQWRTQLLAHIPSLK